MRARTWLRGVVLTLSVGLMGADDAGTPEPPRSPPHSAQELFQGTTVWNVHLSFTPEQWAELEPKPLPEKDRPPASRMQPGPFLAFKLMEGDTDHSGTLSKQELQVLTERWFKDWDEGHRGRLDGQSVRDGLNDTKAAPSQPLGVATSEGPRPDDLAALMGVQFQYAHATLTLEGQTFQDVGVRYKGNFSYLQSSGGLKRSLKVDLDRFVKGQRLGGLSKLNLHSEVTDSSWMNEALSYRLYRDAGVAASRTAFARVTLSVAGKYDQQFVGLYALVEEVDSAFEQENFHSAQGALFKPYTPELFADLGDDWSAYERAYYPKGKTTPPQRARLMEFCKLVSHANDKQFAAQLEQYLDLDAFSRYLATTNWLAAVDSPLMTGHNFYLELDPRTQKFTFIPWDLDFSFGQFALLRNMQMERLSVEHPWVGPKRFLERVLQVPKFKKLYLARMKELNSHAFAPERLSTLVDETAAALRTDVARESEEKRSRFDQLAAGQSVEVLPMKTPGDTSTARPQAPGAFNSEPIRPIKPYARVRSQSVTEQLAGKTPGYVIKTNPIGPGLFFGPALAGALDANHDGALSHEEFTQGFSRWFETWSQGAAGPLTPEQLQAGLAKTFPPPSAATKAPGG